MKEVWLLAASTTLAISQLFFRSKIREGVKYYFADFVRKGGTPPPFTDFFGKKGVTDLGGTPLPPFTDFSPKICLKKGLKIVFFGQKTPDFGPKNRLRIWGVQYTPLPLYGQNFWQKGGFGFGGYPPPPLRAKSAK